MATPPPELADTVELHLQYLDHYRDIIETKLTGLSEKDLRSSPLPSGWTPLGLLNHLVFMERRWLRWGFDGEQIDHPWGDSDDDPDGPWSMGEEASLAELLGKLHEGGAITRRLATGVDPATLGAVGGRFGADDRPTLNWILFHVLQEYARHAGHLDVVRELTDGVTGE